jgi:hypothetical protein
MDRVAFGHCDVKESKSNCEQGVFVEEQELHFLIREAE